MVMEQATVHRQGSRTVYDSEGIELGKEDYSYTTYEYKTLRGGESVEDLKEDGWKKVMIPAFNGSDEKKPLIDGMQIQYLTNDNPRTDLVAGWFVVEDGVWKTRYHTINEDGRFDSGKYYDVELHRLRWTEEAENTLPFAASAKENAVHRVSVTPTKYHYGRWYPAGEAFEGTIAPCPENVTFRANRSSVATEIVKPDGPRQWYRNADIT